MERNQSNARHDLVALSKATAAILPIAKRRMANEDAQGVAGFLYDLTRRLADQGRVEFDHSSVKETDAGVNVNQLLSATERLLKGLEASV